MRENMTCRPVKSALAGAIGGRIRALRLERRWSQRALGAMLGIETSKLSKYENGEHLPPHLTLVQIADVFGVSLDVLMGRRAAGAALGDELAKSMRQLEGLGPKEQSAAAGMIDMLLGLHGMLAKRTRPAGTERLQGARPGPRDARLVRLFHELAALEKDYRDVAASVLEGVLRLLLYVRNPETPCTEVEPR
jgi:transcriptional regulator with XRE-family HTH domain